MTLNKNQLYLIIESVRFHLEDISNFPEENEQDSIEELEELLFYLESNA